MHSLLILLRALKNLIIPICYRAISSFKKYALPPRIVGMECACHVVVVREGRERCRSLGKDEKAEQGKRGKAEKVETRHEVIEKGLVTRQKAKPFARVSKVHISKALEKTVY